MVLRSQGRPAGDGDGKPSEGADAPVVPDEAEAPASTNLGWQAFGPSFTELRGQLRASNPKASGGDAPVLQPLRLRAGAIDDAPLDPPAGAVEWGNEVATGGATQEAPQTELATLPGATRLHSKPDVLAASLAGLDALPEDWDQVQPLPPPESPIAASGGQPAVPSLVQPLLAAGEAGADDPLAVEPAAGAGSGEKSPAAAAPGAASDASATAGAAGQGVVSLLTGFLGSLTGRGDDAPPGAGAAQAGGIASSASAGSDASLSRIAALLAAGGRNTSAYARWPDPYREPAVLRLTAHRTARKLTRQQRLWGAKAVGLEDTELLRQGEDPDAGLKITAPPEPLVDPALRRHDRRAHQASAEIAIVVPTAPRLPLSWRDSVAPHYWRSRGRCSGEFVMRVLNRPSDEALRLMRMNAIVPLPTVPPRGYDTPPPPMPGGSPQFMVQQMALLQEQAAVAQGGGAQFPNAAGAGGAAARESDEAYAERMQLAMVWVRHVARQCDADSACAGFDALGQLFWFMDPFTCDASAVQLNMGPPGVEDGLWWKRPASVVPRTRAYNFTEWPMSLADPSVEDEGWVYSRKVAQAGAHAAVTRVKARERPQSTWWVTDYAEVVGRLLTLPECDALGRYPVPLQWAPPNRLRLLRTVCAATPACAGFSYPSGFLYTSVDVTDIHASPKVPETLWSLSEMPPLDYVVPTVTSILREMELQARSAGGTCGIEDAVVGPAPAIWPPAAAAEGGASLTEDSADAAAAAVEGAWKGTFAHVRPLPRNAPPLQPADASALAPGEAQAAAGAPPPPEAAPADTPAALSGPVEEDEWTAERPMQVEAPVRPPPPPPGSLVVDLNKHKVQGADVNGDPEELGAPPAWPALPPLVAHLYVVDTGRPLLNDAYGTLEGATPDARRGSRAQTGRGAWEVKHGGNSYILRAAPLPRGPLDDDYWFEGFAWLRKRFGHSPCASFLPSTSYPRLEEAQAPPFGRGLPAWHADNRGRTNDRQQLGQTLDFVSAFRVAAAASPSAALLAWEDDCAACGGALLAYRTAVHSVGRFDPAWGSIKAGNGGSGILIAPDLVSPLLVYLATRRGSENVDVSMWRFVHGRGAADYIARRTRVAHRGLTSSFRLAQGAQWGRVRCGGELDYHWGFYAKAGCSTEDVWGLLGSADVAAGTASVAHEGAARSAGLPPPGAEPGVPAASFLTAVSSNSLQAPEEFAALPAGALERESHVRSPRGLPPAAGPPPPPPPPGFPGNPGFPSFQLEQQVEEPALAPAVAADPHAYSEKLFTGPTTVVRQPAPPALLRIYGPLLRGDDVGADGGGVTVEADSAPAVGGWSPSARIAGLAAFAAAVPPDLEARVLSEEWRCSLFSPAAPPGEKGRVPAPGPQPQAVAPPLVIVQKPIIFVPPPPPEY